MPVEAYEDVKSLKSLVQRHLKFTGSEVARRILLTWDKERKNFKKVGLAGVGCISWARAARSLGTAGKSVLRHHGTPLVDSTLCRPF